MKIEEKFLPVGTVVMLKGGSKRVMIIGFYSIENKEDENSKIWDYAGCLYPEGLLFPDQVLLFDHEQIEKVHHYGLIDEEEEAFKKALNEIIAEKEKKPSEKKTTAKKTTKKKKEE